MLDAVPFAGIKITLIVCSEIVAIVVSLYH